MAVPPTVIERPRPSSQPPAAPVIKFEDVSLAFDDKRVLDQISFDLPSGQSKAIFGIAGSGKSTILKLAMGLLKPDSGRIDMLGQDVTRMSEQELFKLRRRIGMVFQE